jgi:hypothetical protein
MTREEGRGGRERERNYLREKSGVCWRMRYGKKKSKSWF